MRELLQPGLHPDAEALNAFSEGALPAHEREQALAHLAVCADCREIVFLAQQAQPVGATATPAEPIWQRWSRSAPVFGIGIGAAALAGALIFAVTLRTHRAASPATPPQTASAHLPAPPSQQPEPIAPKAALQPKPPRAHPPVVSAPEPSPPLKLVPQPPSMARSGREWVTGRDGRGLVGGSNYSAGSGSAPAAELAGGMGPGSGAGVPGGVMPVTPAAAPPAAAADAAPQSVSEMVTVEPQTQTMTAESANAASALPLRAMAKMRSVETVPQPLPSKLPVVAVVSGGVRTLAADSAGALFLSLDAGRHWTHVATQWTGKVKQLRLAPSAAMQLRAEEQQMTGDEARASVAADTGADAISPPAATPAPAKSPAPAPIFQLATDSGAVWLSSDGLHWLPAP